MEKKREKIGLGIVLLKWYGQNARELPWRSDPTPYKVWVSEIMLQQTRVEAGKGYFLRFVEALPDIAALANVSDQMLMKLWEGLGYYNRARNLKKAAGIIIEKYGGSIPPSYEELLTLPGIGPYTAGAIASIAFGIAVPAVDGNVQRVYSRLFDDHQDISTAAAKKWAQEISAAEMPEDMAGAFNQALMDLGAGICIPNGEPKCSICPLSPQCKAFNKGNQSELPVKTAAKSRRIEHRTVLIVETEGKILLHKRNEKGLLAGLWELPNYDGECDEMSIRRELAEHGIVPTSLERLETAKHIFSHIEWHMSAFLIKDETGQKIEQTPAAAEEPAVYSRDNQREGSRWVFVDRTSLKNEYALPSAFKAFRKYL